MIGDEQNDKLAEIIRNWPDEHFDDLWSVCRKYFYAYLSDNPQAMWFAARMDQEYGFKSISEVKR